MKSKRYKIVILLLLSFILFVVWVESEQRFLVRGRVVDASTGKPIEGASVAIHWAGTHLSALIVTYASGTYLIEDASAKSDKDGYFEIPKYFLKSFEMGVYKKGYVCWSNDYIFLKGGRGEIRKGFRVKNGMTIKLEPFTEEYPRFEHAGFIDAVASATRGLEGAGEEMDYFYEMKRKKKK